MKYPKTNAISKEGVNYIRGIVESNNCIFQEFDQKNEVGIDAIIEIIINERTTGKCAGVQIKSGNKKYFDPKKMECKIPIDGHAEYWINYALPVIGIVYVPMLKCAYWIDIKKYFEQFEEDEINQLTTIIFQIKTINIFDSTSFNKYFIKHIIKSSPDITFEESIALFNSKNGDERHIGMIKLFEEYFDHEETWDILIKYFKEEPVEKIPIQLIGILSYIPGHPDIFYRNNFFNSKSRGYALALLNDFNENDIIKLLGLIDEENTISRGSIGQCVEAIISSIPDSDRYLKSIALNITLPELVRECAAAIYAYHNGNYSLLFLYELVKLDKYNKLFRLSSIIECVELYGTMILY